MKAKTTNGTTSNSKTSAQQKKQNEKNEKKYLQTILLDKGIVSTI